MNKYIELHSKGYSNNQIAKTLDISIETVRTMLNRYGLKSNKYPVLENIDKLEQLILGSILGDGCFDVNTHGGVRMSFAHSLKQKDYCLYKHNIFNDYDLAGTYKENKVSGNRYKKGYFEEIRFKTKTHSVFKQYRDLFYINNKRVLNKEVMLDSFNEMALAIWFYDDAHICTASYQITCESLLEEEVSFIVDLLKCKFDIDSTFDKNHNIYIRANSISTLNKIVEQVDVPSMRYKIRGSV